MLLNLFSGLKAAGLPVSLKEHLALMEAMARGLSEFRVEEFYHLARAVLVKDERNLDRFDRVSGEVFGGIERITGEGLAAIPDEWLRKLAEKLLSEEEKRLVVALGEIGRAHV